jgi:hypothetical protein
MPGRDTGFSEKGGGGVAGAAKMQRFETQACKSRTRLRLFTSG